MLGKRTGWFDADGGLLNASMCSGHDNFDCINELCIKCTIIHNEVDLRLPAVPHNNWMWVIVSLPCISHLNTALIRIPESKHTIFGFPLSMNCCLLQQLDMLART